MTAKRGHATIIMNYNASEEELNTDKIENFRVVGVFQRSTATVEKMVKRMGGGGAFGVVVGGRNRLAWTDRQTVSKQ